MSGSTTISGPIRVSRLIIGAFDSCFDTIPRLFALQDYLHKEPIAPAEVNELLLLMIRCVRQSVAFPDIDNCLGQLLPSQLIGLIDDLHLRVARCQEKSIKGFLWHLCGMATRLLVGQMRQLDHLVVENRKNVNDLTMEIHRLRQNNKHLRNIISKKASGE